MLSYKYSAKNTVTGETTHAEVDAQSEQEAAKAIRAQGLVPIQITATGQAGGGGLGRFKKVRTKDRVLFARQLSTLINAGLPLVQALRSVSDQTTSKILKTQINGIISSIEGGQSFSAALQKYPKTFNTIFINLIAAGETSGTLDRSLDRIALQQEKDEEIVRKIRGALVYPAAVVFVMILVVVFMLVKVLPQVQLLYTSFPGATLPIETRILLDLSHFIIHDWWVVLLIVLIGGFGIGWWLKTTSGKRFLDTIKIDIPPFKTLFRKVYMARFCRTSSTLIASGVPLLQVLEISSNAVSNIHVKESVAQASDKVRGGKSLGDSLHGDPYFLDLVPNMLKIGEQSGSTEAMLGKTADYFEKEVDDYIKSISSIIEPVMMILLGAVALIIVAAVLLPVYGLAGSGAINSGT